MHVCMHVCMCVCVFMDIDMICAVCLWCVRMFAVMYVNLGVGVCTFLFVMCWLCGVCI